MRFPMHGVTPKYKTLSISTFTQHIYIHVRLTGVSDAKTYVLATLQENWKPREDLSLLLRRHANAWNQSWMALPNTLTDNVRQHTPIFGPDAHLVDIKQLTGTCSNVHIQTQRCMYNDAGYLYPVIKLNLDVCIVIWHINNRIAREKVTRSTRKHFKTQRRYSPLTPNKTSSRNNLHRSKTNTLTISTPSDIRKNKQTNKSIIYKTRFNNAIIKCQIHYWQIEYLHQQTMITVSGQNNSVTFYSRNKHIEYI